MRKSGHLHRPAAMAARFDVELEHPLQALPPGHGRMSRRCRPVRFLARAPAALTRCYLRAQVAIGRKHAVKPRQVHARFRHQRRQPRHEIQRAGEQNLDD